MKYRMILIWCLCMFSSIHGAGILVCNIVTHVIAEAALTSLSTKTDLAKYMYRLFERFHDRKTRSLIVLSLILRKDLLVLSMYTFTGESKLQ